MRKIKFFLVLSFLTLNRLSDCNGQIILDTTIVPMNGWGYDVYPVQLSANETKYLFADTVTNTFSLYNMDFTPFMMNISVPEPFAAWTFQVIYVSRTLFDCDSSNIEYVYEASLGNLTHPFYIMRTDGTQLFKLDSAIGHYGIGAIMGGSHTMRPIENTSSGAKLYLHYVPEGQAVKIYSLCGSLPESTFDNLVGMHQSYVKIFSNPSSTSLSYEIILPDHINQYFFAIVDNSSKEIMRLRVSEGKTNNIIDMTKLSSGVYYYSLYSEKKVYQTGKFILTK